MLECYKALGVRRWQQPHDSNCRKCCGSLKGQNQDPSKQSAQRHLGFSDGPCICPRRTQYTISRISFFTFAGPFRVLRPSFHSLIEVVATSEDSITIVRYSAIEESIEDALKRVGDDNIVIYTSVTGISIPWVQPHRKCIKARNPEGWLRC